MTEKKRAILDTIATLKSIIEPLQKVNKNDEINIVVAKII